MNDDEKTQGDFCILNPDGSSQYIGSSAYVSVEEVNTNSEAFIRLMADEMPSTPAEDRYRLLSAIDNNTDYAAPLFDLPDLGDALNEIKDDSKTQTVDRAVKSTKRIISINKE